METKYEYVCKVHGVIRKDRVTECGSDLYCYVCKFVEEHKVEKREIKSDTLLERDPSDILLENMVISMAIENRFENRLIKVEETLAYVKYDLETQRQYQLSLEESLDEAVEEFDERLDKIESNRIADITDNHHLMDGLCLIRKMMDGMSVKLGFIEDEIIKMKYSNEGKFK